MRRLAHSGEDGFTMVEVVFATLIFFIAFTALMTMMVGAQTVAVRSKERADIVNAAAGYIERARLLPFDRVGVAPAGDLSQETTTVGMYTMTITPVVAWVDDPNITGADNYKKLTVTVDASAPGTDTAMSYVAETMIKVADYYVRPDPPTIAWTNDSPADQSVVHGSAVVIGAAASANGAGTTLYSMNIYCGSVPMRDNVNGTAQWSLSQASESRTFWWNTLATDDTGAQYSVDGKRTLKAEVWDSNGQQAFVTRQVIVDNYAPTSTASVSAAGLTNTQEQLTWPVAMDGTDPAANYQIVGWKQQPNQDLWNYNSSWAVVPTAGTTLTVEPFTRYYWGVEALSPRGLYSTTRYIPAPAISRSTLSGTWTDTHTDPGRNGDSVTTSIAFTLGPPNFPYTGSATSTLLYKSTTPNMSSIVSGWPKSMGTDTWTYTDTLPAKAVGKTGVQDKFYYQAVTTVVPVGWPSYPNPPVTVRSAVIGPNSGPVVAAVTTGTMATAGWTP